MLVFSCLSRKVSVSLHQERCQITCLREIYVERIHNTKEQIYFYKRAENHKAKERMFKSIKRANCPGKHPDAGMGHIYQERGLVSKNVWGFALLILSH